MFYLLNLNSLLFGVFLKKCQNKIFTPGRHSELSQISKIKRFADLKTVKYFLKKLHLRSLAPCLRAFCQHIYLNWTPERMVSQELVASSLSIHKDRTVVKFSAKWQQTSYQTFFHLCSRSIFYFLSMSKLGQFANGIHQKKVHIFVPLLPGLQWSKLKLALSIVNNEDLNFSLITHIPPSAPLTPHAFTCVFDNFSRIKFSQFNNQ